MISVLAPNGKYYNFTSKDLIYKYSDGEEHNRQTKKEEVWQISNSKGNWMWNNVEGKFVENTSNKKGKENTITFSGKMGTTYSGEDNPMHKSKSSVYDYSQPPQNLADAIGFRHDKDYDDLYLTGKSGVMDKRSSWANIRLIMDSEKLIKAGESGEIDPYTGVKIVSTRPNTSCLSF